MRKAFLFCFLFTLYFSPPAQYYLKDLGADDICNRFGVESSGNQNVKVPEHIRLALECSPNIPAFSPDGKSMVLYSENQVLCYNPASDGEDTLLRLHSSTIGISDFIFNEIGNSFAFVSISEDTAGNKKTVLHAIVLRDGKVTKNLSQEVKVNYSCDSRCTSNAINDFWFEDDRTLAYLTWNTQPYDLEGKNAEKFFSLY